MTPNSRGLRIAGQISLRNIKLDTIRVRTKWSLGHFVLTARCRHPQMNRTDTGHASTEWNTESTIVSNCASKCFAFEHASCKLSIKNKKRASFERTFLEKKFWRFKNVLKGLYRIEREREREGKKWVEFNEWEWRLLRCCVRVNVCTKKFFFVEWKNLFFSSLSLSHCRFLCKNFQREREREREREKLKNEAWTETKVHLSSRTRSKSVLEERQDRQNRTVLRSFTHFLKHEFEKKE